MIIEDGVEMLDVREAAVVVHRTPETVRRWVRFGRLHARKRGNRLLLEPRAVEAMAPARTRTPGPTLAERADLAAQFQELTPHGPRRASSSADLVLDDRRSR